MNILDCSTSKRVICSDVLLLAFLETEKSEPLQFDDLFELVEHEEQNENFGSKSGHFLVCEWIINFQKRTLIENCL
jgi:hypothetical protein